MNNRRYRDIGLEGKKANTGISENYFSPGYDILGFALLYTSEVCTK